MLTDNTIVKHKTLGCIGLIDGITRLKEIFTGNKECEWQYRIKIPDDDKRLIAPEEDIEVVKDLDPQEESKILKHQVSDNDGPNGEVGRLKADGYQISEMNHGKRVDILRSKSIPKYGVNSVIYELGGFMISRGLKAEQRLKFANALNEWNKDINWIVETYKATNPWVLTYRDKKLRPKLESKGYNWKN